MLCEMEPSHMLAIPEAADRDDVFMTTAGLAARWCMDAASLANYRSRGEGIPFVKLPTGAVRYRLVDILEAEQTGQFYHSWALMAEAMRTCPGLDLGDKEIDRILSHCRNHMMGVVAARLKERTTDAT